MSKILPTSGIKWIDLKEFEMNKYTFNSSKDCVFEVDLEYLKNQGNYIMVILWLQIK